VELEVEKAKPFAVQPPRGGKHQRAQREVHVERQHVVGLHGPVRNAAQNVAGVVVVAPAVEEEPAPGLNPCGNAEEPCHVEMRRSREEKRGVERVLDSVVAEKVVMVGIAQRNGKAPSVVAVPVDSSEAQRMGNAGERPPAEVLQGPPRQPVVEGYRGANRVRQLAEAPRRQPCGDSPRREHPGGHVQAALEVYGVCVPWDAVRDHPVRSRIFLVQYERFVEAHGKSRGAQRQLHGKPGYVPEKERLVGFWAVLEKVLEPEVPAVAPGRKRYA